MTQKYDEEAWKEFWEIANGCSELMDNVECDDWRSSDGSIDVHCRLLLSSFNS